MWADSAGGWRKHNLRTFCGELNVSKNKRNDSKGDALRALESRLRELNVRLSHAKILGDAEKIESILKKILVAARKKSRLIKKTKR